MLRSNPWYLSIYSWYKRSEMGTRIAVFFSSATVAGAFSELQSEVKGHTSLKVVGLGGLLAAAISNMNGVGGKAGIPTSSHCLRIVYWHISLHWPGWQWIFILEGLATILISFISFWIIPDFPTTAKFLTEEEREISAALFLIKHSPIARRHTSGIYVVRRLEDDMKLSAAGESFQIKYVIQSLKDWKTWVASTSLHLLSSEFCWFRNTLLVGIYMGLWVQPIHNYLTQSWTPVINVSDGPLYAFSLFLPTIINQVCMGCFAILWYTNRSFL